MPFLPDIPPELLDFLIQKEKKEKKEQKEQEKQPFLQLPMPNLPPKPEKNGNNDVIIIDL